MIGTWVKKLVTSIKQFAYEDSTDVGNFALGIIGKVGLLDAQGNPITSLGGASSGANDTHTTASGQISAVANSGGKTITLSGLPFTLLAEHVIGGSIKKIDTNGDAIDLPLTNITVSGDVITLGDIEDFVVTDEVSVVLRAIEKGYDFNQDVVKSNIENPEWDHNTSSENLASGSDIGAIDDTWIDQGGEIDCRGFNIITIWVNFAVNNSTGNQLQILSKHESAGADEYVEENTADYQKTIGDSSIKVKYEYFVNNSTPYIQIQTKATLIGATEGTVTIEVTKGY